MWISLDPRFPLPSAGCPRAAIAAGLDGKLLTDVFRPRDAIITGLAEPAGLVCPTAASHEEVFELIDEG